MNHSRSTGAGALNQAFGDRELLDGFLVGPSLGHGGFGNVYLGVHVRTGERAAIKVLRVQPNIPPLTWSRQVAHFEREAQLAGELRHLHIVRLLHYGRTSRDVPYAIYEYLPGETLRQTLASRGPLPLPLAVEIMGQVLSGLACAHRDNIVHCDIKPDNVMLLDLQGKPHVKILDLGSGQQTLEGSAHGTGGTPRYCSPEYLGGATGTPGVDLFAWGVVFIEALTGQPSSRVPDQMSYHPLAPLLADVLHQDVCIRSTSADKTLKRLRGLTLDPLPQSLSQGTPESSNVEPPACETLLNLELTATTDFRSVTALCLSLDVCPVAGHSVNWAHLDAQQFNQLSQCARALVRFGGEFVFRAQDDVLVYFHDTEQETSLAARTALELVAEVKGRSAHLESEAKMAVSVRIGIHSGSVPFSNDSIRMVGGTPSTAQRLASFAEPNSVLVSEAFAKHLPPSVQLARSLDQTLNRSATASATFRLLDIAPLIPVTCFDSKKEAATRREKDSRRRHSTLVGLSEEVRRASETLCRNVNLLKNRSPVSGSDQWRSTSRSSNESVRATTSVKDLW